jgi:hypothetical protein
MLIRVFIRSAWTEVKPHVDSAQNESITLRCGDYAESLAIVDTEQRFASTKPVGDN